MEAAEVTSPPETLTIYTLYVDKDADWAHRVLKSLRRTDPTERPQLRYISGLETPLPPDWKVAMRQSVAQCNVVILFLSKALLDSEASGQPRLKLLLQAQPEDGFRIVPVLVSACPWRSDPSLSHLSALPGNDTPLDSLMGRDLDKALDLIADAVLGVVPAPPGGRPPNIQMSHGTFRRVPVSDLRDALLRVPNLPAHYVPRDKIVAELKKQLFRRASSDIPVSGPQRVLRLLGESGVGKTVVATAFARDDEIFKAFSDGVFWLNVGEGYDKFAAEMRLAQTLKPSNLELESGEQSRSIIQQALQLQRILLILDDVEPGYSLDAFVGSEGLGRILITTSDMERRFGPIEMLMELEMPSNQEALQILASHAGFSNSVPLPNNAAEVVDECEHLSLALAVVGALVRKRAVSGWGHALELLRNTGLQKPRRDFNPYVFAARKAIHASTNLLSGRGRDLFTRLSEFTLHKIWDIALEQICRLWEVEESEALSLLSELADRNLLSFDTEARVVTLHALVAETLRRIGPLGEGSREEIPGLTKEHAIPYCSDTPEGEDQLGITPDVNAFAAVLASMQVQPPLCLGIFGDWGTGKTFFMDKLKARIELLATETRKALEKPHNGTPAYCPDIAQISFNAWHYVDANLWASLACRIFEGLDEHLAGPPPDAAGSKAKLFLELETARLEKDCAQKEKEVAQEALRKAHEKLVESKSDSEAKCIALSKLWPKAVEEALNEDKPELRKQLNKVAMQLGYPSLVENIDEIRKTLRDIGGLSGRFKAAWLDISTGKHSNKKLAMMLALIVLVPPLLGLGLQIASPSVLFGSLSGFLVQLLACVSVISGCLKKVADWGGQGLKEFDNARNELERIVDKIRQHPPAEEKVLKEELAKCHERESVAKLAVEAAEERVKKAEEKLLAVDNITDGRRMAEFIRDRVRSSDYRSRLGIISTIRCDFQSLSNFLTGSATRAAPAVGETDDSRNPAGDPLKIDRIILYIDDLDRCPEHKVVEVLQAVHLLLYFKLFVVVLAVDSRWLVLSLERQYRALQNAEAETNPTCVDRADLMSTTPQNYLEKIIQIPFNLRPMNPNAFARLVTSLLPKTAESMVTDVEQNATPTPKPVQTSSREGKDPSDEASPPSQPDEEREQPMPEGESSPPRADTDDTLDGGEMDEGDPESDQEPEARKETIDLSPSSLWLTEGEEEFIKGLSKMVATPRSVKRLVNIYCVIRAAVPEHKLPSFLGRTNNPPEYPSVLTLLAIQIGFPRAARTFFRQILQCENDRSWYDFVEMPPDRRAPAPSSLSTTRGTEPSAAEEAEALRLHGKLNEMRGVWDRGLGIMPFKRRVHTVIRFSFRGLDDSSGLVQSSDEESYPG